MQQRYLPSFLGTHDLVLTLPVNNAGVDPYDYIKTIDGFEMTMAVKYDSCNPLNGMFLANFLVATLGTGH